MSIWSISRQAGRAALCAHGQCPRDEGQQLHVEGFPERNNSELVAIYGNFVNRALQLTKKYWNGVVLTPEISSMLIARLWRNSRT